jgi:Tfp pilus assembly protein PilO
MSLPVKRIFEETRRLVIPVLGGLALNVILYAGVVYPLGVRERTTEQREEAAARELLIAEREDAAARGVVEGRDRTDAALKTFYQEVLPASLARARQSTYLRLAQLADRHSLRQARRSFEPDTDPQSTLSRLRITMSLQGEYEDIRRFIYDVETGTDFVVIDSVALAQGAEPGSPLTLTLGLSTYYRTEPNGA